MGMGIGLAGQTYAIPTKDYNIKTLPLSIISKYVSEFIEIAAKNKNLIFYVTAIGCGLAGYEVEDIAPLFVDAGYIENIYLPQSFWDFYRGEIVFN